MLAAGLGHRYDLAVQKKPDEAAALVHAREGGEKSGQLQTPANNSAILVEAGMKGIPAFHLEAMPRFCKTDDGKDAITDDGLVLGRAMAQTILRIWVEDELKNVEKSYEAQVRNMTGAYHREIARTKEYHGRQLLELLQNADDEAEKAEKPAVLIKLEQNRLIVANNGSPFSREGVLSLMYSDTSPKIRRKKKIGYKGLGFRAILNWSDSIRIKSGAFSLEFSRPNAVSFLKKILEKNPGLKDAVNEASTTEYPIATLSVPSWMDTQDSDSGEYETCVIINFSSDQIRDDIQAQINELGMEIALFLNNTKKIQLESPGRNETIVRMPAESEDFEEIRLLDQQGNTIKSKKWRVFNKAGELPEELRKEEMAKQFEYDLRIAVSEKMDDTINRLFCYFKTEVKFPFPAIIHGTFDLDDSRNHLNQNAVNEFLLKKLAELMIETAMEIAHADKRVSWDAMKLLTKRGEYDDKVEKMEFAKKLLASMKTQTLIPVLSNKYMSADEKPVFYDIRLAETLETVPSEFPELALFTADKEIHDLIRKLGIGRYDPEELVKRLNKVSLSLPLEQRADLILMMVNHYDQCLRQLQPDKMPTLFIDDQGRVIDSKTKALTPPERGKFQLPEIVRIVFISTDLFNLLKAKTGIKGGGALAQKLARFNVQEYRFDTVISRAVVEINRAIKRVPSKKKEYIRKMIDSLFSIFKDNSEPDKKFPERINVPLLTRKGELKNAKELYFGREYPVGRVMDTLYSGINDSVFVATKEELGFDTRSENEAVEFLKWVGVEEFPRVEQKVLDDSDTKKQYMDYVLIKLKYPYVTDYEEMYKSYNDFKSDRAHPSKISVADIIELDTILEKAKFEDILAWLHLDPRVQNILRQGHEPPGSSFGLWLGRNTNPRKVSYVDISPYIVWKLSRTEWIKTKSGRRVAPNQCCLSETLEGLSPLIEVPDINIRNRAFKDNGIQQRDVEYLLTKLGASEDFSNLPTATVYAILGKLETADPDGEKAKNIYTKIIDSKAREWAKAVAKKEPRNTFVKQGKILAKSNGQVTYLPVEKVYYVDNITFCREIMNKFNIVQIPRRRGKEQVREIFGVRPLEDIQFSLTSYPDIHPVNAEFSKKFEKFKPYILVFRLGRPSFSTEMNQLKKLKICLCTRMEAKYKFDNTEGELTLNPYEHVQPIGENTAYLLLNPSRQYREAADLEKDIRFCDALSEIISGVLKVDENRKDWRELFAKNKQERETVIQSDLDDQKLEKLKEVRSRLRDITDVHKEFWKNILLAKGIDEDLSETGHKEETIHTLSEQLGIQEALVMEVFETINYENLSEIQNLPHIKKLFNVLKITVKDFNLHSAEEMDFSKAFESDIANEKFRLQKKFQTHLYETLKDKDIGSKEQFASLMNTYARCSFADHYDINQELSADKEKCFNAAFQEDTFKDLGLTHTSLSSQEEASLEEVYNKNRQYFLQKIEQSGGAYSEDVNEFMEKLENKSLLYFAEYEELIKRFYTKYSRPTPAGVGGKTRQIITKKKIILNGKEQEYEEDNYDSLIKSIDDDHEQRKYDISEYNPSKPLEITEEQYRTRSGARRGRPIKKHTKEIGLIGEYYVYKTLLTKYGRDKVLWVSENAKTANVNPQGSESEGYDIRYIDDNDHVHYVEVKSSSTDEQAFHISSDEVKFGEIHRKGYEVIIILNTLDENREMRNLRNIFDYCEEESFNNNSKFSVENEGFKIRFQ